MRGNQTMHYSTPGKQRGMAVLTMIFIAVFLIGLTAVVSSRAPATNQIGTFIKASDLVSQVQLIRSQIAKCAMNYPSGNNGSANHLAYPYYGTAANTGVAATGAVSGLYCPGTGSGNNTDATDANLWSGTDGVFLPAAPGDFGAWQYANDATSVRLTIAATDARWNAAIDQAIAKIGSSSASRATNTLTVVITN